MLHMGDQQLQVCSNISSVHLYNSRVEVGEEKKKTSAAAAVWSLGHDHRPVSHD